MEAAERKSSLLRLTTHFQAATATLQCNDENNGPRTRAPLKVLHKRIARLESVTNEFHPKMKSPTNFVTMRAVTRVRLESHLTIKQVKYHGRHEVQWRKELAFKSIDEVESMPHKILMAYHDSQALRAELT